MQNNYIIVFIDVVSFTQTNEVEQSKIFSELQKELSYLLYDEFHISDSLILIPTGDGMIIALQEKSIQNYHFKAIQLVMELFKWSQKINIKLRYVLHVGSASCLKDINKNNNIVGNTINNSARMLNSASENCIVVSEEFFNKYLKVQKLSFGLKYPLNNNEKISYKILEEDYILDKHENVHRVFSLQLYDEKQEYGNNSKILNRYNAKIYSTEYNKIVNMKERFFKLISSGIDINLFGIYHPNTPAILSNIQANQNKQVSINIYYASDKIKDELQTFFSDTKDNLGFEKKSESLNSVQKWIENNENKEYIKLKIFEYDFLPCFGASTIDISHYEKGFIHISNYINNILPKDTPYIELYWKTKFQPPLYKFYYDYLNAYILNKGKLIFEN